VTKNAKVSGTARKWRYPSRDEHPDVDIYVHQEWCKCCGICYELCPTGVFEADKSGRPVLAHPEKCISCYLCERLCPDMAITVYKERKKKAESDGTTEDEKGAAGK
jgi:2-oxoglutarate ferredoxin oxidoreductase subunit delta